MAAEKMKKWCSFKHSSCVKIERNYKMDALPPGEKTGKSSRI